MFERQTASAQHSDHHPIPAFSKDFETVLKVLEEEEVFMPTNYIVIFLVFDVIVHSNLP